MDWTKLGELGAVTLALLAVIMLIDFIRRRQRETESGDRRRLPVVIDCPNEIEGLNATLRALVEESRAQTELNSREIEVLIHNRQCLDTLVKSHAPVDGREWWKTTAKQEAVQEEIRDGIKELVRIAKKNGGR